MIPNLVFLELSELQVSIKSPSPDNPNKVFLLTLKIPANLVISANDLEMSALLAFSPKFKP